MTTEYELMHHGILGMKWGVRRYQAYGEGGYNPKHKGKNKLTKEQSHRARKAAKVQKIRSQRKADSKDRIMLSDKALDEKIKRLQKEKQLRELTEEQLHPGKTFVKKAVKPVALTAASGAVALGGYLLLQKAFGSRVQWKGVTKLKKVGKHKLALVDKRYKVPAGIKIGKVNWDEKKDFAKKVMGGAKAFKPK